MDTVHGGSVEMQVPSQVAEVRENAVQNLRSVSMVLFYPSIREDPVIFSKQKHSTVYLQWGTAALQ